MRPAATLLYFCCNFCQIFFTNLIQFFLCKIWVMTTWKSRGQLLVKGSIRKYCFLTVSLVLPILSSFFLQKYGWQLRLGLIIAVVYYQFSQKPLNLGDSPMTIHSNLRKDGCRRKSLVFQEWVTQQDFVKIVSKWEGSRMADENPYKWTACHPAWIFSTVGFQIMCLQFGCRGWSKL